MSSSLAKQAQQVWFARFGFEEGRGAKVWQWVSGACGLLVNIKGLVDCRFYLTITI